MTLLLKKKQEIKYLDVRIYNRWIFQNEFISLLKRKDCSWNKSHVRNSHLVTQIIIETNLERSCFESPSLLCRSYSIDWIKSFSVNRKTNQLSFESFFSQVEIWVNQRTEIRTKHFIYKAFHWNQRNQKNIILLENEIGSTTCFLLKKWVNRFLLGQ